jgi:integrase
MEIGYLFKDNIGGIVVTATLDTRKPTSDETYRLSIRVAHNREKTYIQTGKRVTWEGYEGLLKARGTKGEFSVIKNEIKESFDKVCGIIKKLNSTDTFSMNRVREEMGRASATKVKTFLEEWQDFAMGKKAQKTRDQYLQSCNSFYKSLGCHLARIKVDGILQRRMAVKGPKMRLKPKEITIHMVENWRNKMTADGLTIASQGMYLRSFRALMIHLAEKGKMPKLKFTIDAGERRQDDFLTVPDIVKIRDYQGTNKWAADWWIILYLCNGCNLRDLATLTWTDHYTYDKELTFIRSKTSSKAPTRVFIPVIPALQDLLDKYATLPEEGQRVFPQILANAFSESQITERVHGFNMKIGEGMKAACEELGIRPATPAYARNSYITTLTWHAISDVFIDAMVGHTSGNNVLRGYQGKISPKKRAAINAKLFIDPEEE